MVTIAFKQKNIRRWLSLSSNRRPGVDMVTIVFKQKTIRTCRYGNDCFQTEDYNNYVDMAMIVFKQRTMRRYG